MSLSMVECATEHQARRAGGIGSADGWVIGACCWRKGVGGKALEDAVDLKLDHYNKDGIEIVDVEGEIDVYTAPRLRELLIDLVNNGNHQIVVNMEKVEFLDSTGLGVLVGGLKRVRAHDGSLDLVCTQERILKIFRITGLTKVFGIHNSVDEAIKARKSEK